MNILLNYTSTIKKPIVQSCYCIENNVLEALKEWQKHKNDFFHSEITEIFNLSTKHDLKHEFNNNLSEKTLTEIKNMLFVLDLQIENNISFPYFLMKYYGITYNQSCVIINCLHMMDFCSHEISLKYPFITNKGKKVLDSCKNDYNLIKKWLNSNICTFDEFQENEANNLHKSMV